METQENTELHQGVYYSLFFLEKYIPQHKWTHVRRTIYENAVCSDIAVACRLKRPKNRFYTKKNKSQ